MLAGNVLRRMLKTGALPHTGETLGETVLRYYVAGGVVVRGLFFSVESIKVTGKFFSQKKIVFIKKNFKLYCK
jgi:hypothetical protein